MRKNLEDSIETIRAFNDGLAADLLASRRSENTSGIAYAIMKRHVEFDLSSLAPQDDYRLRMQQLKNYKDRLAAVESCTSKRLEPVRELTSAINQATLPFYQTYREVCAPEITARVLPEDASAANSLVYGYLVPLALGQLSQSVAVQSISEAKHAIITRSHRLSLET